MEGSSSELQSEKFDQMTGGMSPDEYVKQRLESQITWYDNKSSSNKWKFLTLRVVEITAAAIIPLLAGFSSAAPSIPIVIGVIGIIIALCAGLTSLFDFQEHWIEYRTTTESLKKEKFMFLTRTAPYGGNDAFTLLVQRAETLISKENTNWAQYMMKPKKEDESSDGKN
jgi:hypothetical protein